MARQQDRGEAVRAAYRSLFGRILDEIDREVSEQAGFPWITPSASRESVWRGFVTRPEVARYDPRKGPDRALLAVAFRKHARPEIAIMTEAFRQNLRRQDSRVVKQLRDQLRAGTPETDGQPYSDERAQARNLELLSFVAERVIPFWRLTSGKLKPGHRGPTVATPWDALKDEWSRNHERRPFECSKTLADQYYRAVRRIGPEFAAGLERVLLEVIGELGRDPEQVGRRIYREAAARRDELLTQQPLARKPAHTWTQKEKAAWRQWRREETGRYRAGLTLEALLARHLWGAVRRDHLDAAGMQRYHQAPLRPWFLLEAREARGEEVPIDEWLQYNQDPLTEVFDLQSWPR